MGEGGARWMDLIQLCVEWGVGERWMDLASTLCGVGGGEEVGGSGFNSVWGGGAYVGEGG